MPLADFLNMGAMAPPALPSMAPIEDALARNAALGQQQQPQGSGGLIKGFGVNSPLRNFLGAIADAVATIGGGQAMYGPQIQQRRKTSALQQYLGQLDPELGNLIGAGLDGGDAVSLYKMRHPEADKPPSFIQEYLYRQNLPPEQRQSFDEYANLRKFNPYAAPITLGANDTIEGGGTAPDSGEVTATNPQTGEKVRWNGSTWEPLGGQTASPSGGFPVSKVMDALTAQESGGDGTAVGPQTRYGRAYGSTQLQPATAKAMAAKRGLPFMPQMLQSNDPKALAYQRTLAEAYLTEGLDRTGNIRDALHYYHGGPDRSLWGPKTQAYANEVLGRLGVR